MNAPASRSAFTFVEVLVALAILALAGLVLASACVHFLDAQQAAFRRDEQAADRQLVRQALFAEPSRERVEQWNDLPMPGNRMARWRATLTPTPVADLFDVALELDLPTGKEGTARLSAENLRLLRPTWSQGSEREVLRATAMNKLARRKLP